MKTIGILLAGGASRRFGSPKAFAIKNNRNYYEYSYDALLQVCDEVIIVTRKELLKNFPPNICVIIDDSQFVGMGPLAGIYSAMTYISADRYVVLPCDMPFITGNVLEALYKQSIQNGVTAVVHGEKKHPLVSVWSSPLKVYLRTALEKEQLSVVRFLSQVQTKWVTAQTIANEPAICFQNLNEPK